LEDSFNFEVIDIFGIVGRGIVFRGNVLSGSLITNQTVKFNSNDVEYTAQVSSIELDRKIVDKTVLGNEVGLLLEGFNIHEINELYLNAPDVDELDAYPSAREVLGINFPFIIQSINLTSNSSGTKNSWLDSLRSLF